MGKQYYAALFIQASVPLLDIFISFSTLDWLGRTNLSHFLMILWYREIIDMVLNIIVSIIMIIYRFYQKEFLANLIIRSIYLVIFVNVVLIMPFIVSPHAYFHRYKEEFHKNHTQAFFRALTQQFKCCGFMEPRDIKDQTCRSYIRGCVPAISKAIFPSIRSKIILLVIISSLQLVACFLISSVQASGEGIEASEEEENEETPLMAGKEQSKVPRVTANNTAI